MVGVVLVAALAFAQAHPIPNTEYVDYEGTVSVVELDGKTATERDGDIVFGVFPRVTDTFTDLSHIVRGTGIFLVDSAVTHGRFRFRAVMDSMFVVVRLELGGDIAHVRGNHPYAPTPTDPWRIEADRQLVRSVRFVAAEDDAALEHLVVANADDEFHKLPPDYEVRPVVLLEDASSPIEFAALDADPSREPETSFWVRAPHREWRRFDVHFGKDARNVVRLEPAASLVVELDRAIAEDGACVDLYEAKQFDGAGDRWIDRILSSAAQPRDRRRCGGSKRVVFDPVPPGDYAAVVVVQDSFDAARLPDGSVPIRRVSGYGIARVSVPPKSASKVSIAVTERGLHAGVEFSGTLRIDPAWGEELPTLYLWTWLGFDNDENGQPRTHTVHATDYRAIEGTPNSYRWTFGPVPPGRWALRVDGWSQFSDVVVGSEGTAHRDLELGPPVETLVQIVDDATGQPAGLEELHFGVGENSGFCPRAATRTARRGEFVVRSPAGPIELMTWQRDYWGFHDSVEIAVDIPKVVLRARQLGGVHLHLTVDGKPLRPEGFSSRLVGVGETKGGAPKPAFSSAEGNVLLVVAETGRYRLEITAGVGMAAVPPREFDLAPGVFEDLNLELAHSK